MRSFSELEKTLIRAMVDFEPGDRLCKVGNIITSPKYGNILKDNRHIKFERRDEVTLSIEAAELQGVVTETGGMQKFDIEVSNLILTLVSLFDYLARESLISLIRYTDRPNNWREEDVDKRYAGARFIDDEIMPQLFDLACSKIFVYQSLRDLVDRNFKSEEDIKFEEQQKVAKDSLKAAQDSVKAANASVKGGEKSLKWAIKSVYIAATALIVSGTATYCSVNGTTSVEIQNPYFDEKLSEALVPLSNAVDGNAGKTAEVVEAIENKNNDTFLEEMKQYRAPKAPPKSNGDQ